MLSIIGSRSAASFHASPKQQRQQQQQAVWCSRSSSFLALRPSSTTIMSGRVTRSTAAKVRPMDA